MKYNGPYPISIEKKRDLQSLLNLVPPVFHDFYENLVTSESASEVDPDLMEDDIDGDD